MSDLKALLERAERAVSVMPLPPDGLDGLQRRRDRKRRNQRIAAGVVGIAVFVAAVWIVTSGLPLDRSAKSVAPAGEVNGPTTTGPTATGPTATGTPNPFAVDNDVVGLPPEGATLSKPARGELVASNDSLGYHARVYADGRLIWQQGHSLWFERRLTPEGIDLVRSQPELLERSHPELVIAFESLPASAWEDSHAKQYLAPRYGVCTSRDGIQSLPQRAKDLLGDYTNDQAVERGEVEFFAGSNGSTCPAVTVDEARELDLILRDVGYRRTEESYESVWYEIGGFNPSLVLTMLLPDGSLAQSGGR
jgi:hypothetical protein